MEAANVDGLTEAGRESRQLWDAPTRILHWLMALTVILLLFTGFVFMYRRALGFSGQEPKAMLQVVHVLIAYVFVASLLGRLGWGFFGNRFVRWGAGPGLRKALRGSIAEIRALLSRAPVRTGFHARLERSPITQLVAAVFFVVLGVQTATGLIRAATDLYWPPLGGLLAEHVAKPGVDPADIDWRTAREMVDREKIKPFGPPAVLAGQAHKYGAYLLLVLASMHVLGVVLSELRENSGIVSTMISGRRTLREEEEASD